LTSIVVHHGLLTAIVVLSAIIVLTGIVVLSTIVVLTGIVVLSTIVVLTGIVVLTAVGSVIVATGLVSATN